MVLDDSSHRVEEDEDDDQPEPPLLLAHPPHPELELFQSQHDACNSKTNIYDFFSFLCFPFIEMIF